MTTDLFNGMSFNDGEGINHTDFNNLSRYQLARLMDQIIHPVIGSYSISSGKDLQFGGQDGTDHPTSRAYCLNPGAAYLRQGSGNSKIQLAPGTLLQKIGASSGTEAQLIPYTFVGTEEWTLTNGDVTNPRVDLLQMKLEWIDSPTTNRDFEDATTRVVTSQLMSINRRVQCTLSVKVGAAGASPQIPEPDAGYVPVGSVMVGNGWTTAGAAPVFGQDTVALNNVVVHDQRLPIRIRTYTVDGAAFRRVTAFTQVLSTSSEGVSATSATNLAWAFLSTRNLGRLVGVSIAHKATTGIYLTSGMTLGYIPDLSTNYQTRNTYNITSVSPNTTNYVEEVVPFFNIENAHLPNVGPTILQSATTKIGVPLWTNGQRCPIERQRLLALTSRNPGYMALRFQNIPVGGGFSEEIYNVTFYVAEGI